MTGRVTSYARAGALIVALSVLALGSGAPGPAAAAADDPIGTHSMLQLSDPPSFMQAMFAEAAAMHASAIRLDVAPAIVFRSSSQPPDFSGLDEVLALAQLYHLRVVGDLFTIPWWLADCVTPTSLSEMDRCGTDQLSEYQSLITQIVARSDPVIRDWEIWNEPDTSEFFTGTPQQYALMLRAAHDAIKSVDPTADVLLGGISSTAGTSWLAQVFATPGADAAQAFDTANIHERNALDELAPDVAGWRRFLVSYGFSGPLWVTEHGYPSDPAYQYDPSYTGGPGSQSAYLTASIPTLLDAGAAEVFVTERDNLGGQFASEGVLGGDVADPPVADPQMVEKPAFGAVSGIAECYAALGRDCPGAPPMASPASLALAPTRLGTSTAATVTLSDPGPAPLELGPPTIAGAGRPQISVRRDGCSGQLLEPDQTCAVSVQFTATAGGAAGAVLDIPSDSGSLRVPVTAVAPSASSLTWPRVPAPRFVPTHGADGVGHTQRLVLTLINPLSAPVSIARSTVSGADDRRFRVQSDKCAGTALASGARCRLTVLFTPVRPGPAHAVLTLRGAGTPLSFVLRATAFALPAITRLSGIGAGACPAISSRAQVVVEVDQPAVVRWKLVRRSGPPPGGCAPVLGAPGVRRKLSSADGEADTGPRPTAVAGVRGYAARLRLPVAGGHDALAPGAYVLVLSPISRHGAGASRSILVALTD